MKQYYIWLIKVMGYSNPVTIQLLKRFGTAKDVYSAFQNNIAAAGAEYANTAEKTNLESAEKILASLEEKKIVTITIEDALYPKLLKESENPPCVLFAFGNTNLLKNDLVAITGSRKITDYVIRAETSACEKLCENYTLIASLTTGCEQLACITSSKCGKGCIELMPCGFDREYPKGSRVLRQQILLNNGCLLSEFLPEISSSNTNFLRRARILGSISKAMIVFQAGLNSGALNAAKYSSALFFLPPNDIFAREYAGAVQCVRNGASLYLSEDDIKRVFSGDHIPRRIDIKKLKQEKTAPKTKKTVAENKKSSSESSELSEELFETPLHNSVYTQIVESEKPLTFDEIFRNLDTDIATLSYILLDLEVMEKIIAIPGNRYKLRD